MHPDASGQSNKTVFQSAPGREAGRCMRSPLFADRNPSFNPRPAVRPGDAGGRCRYRSARRRFNPRPAVRPGDAGAGKSIEGLFLVSIRARP